MDEVKINTSKTLTLTLPSDPASNTVSVSLYHEFGDLVSGPTNATRTGTGVYSITYGQQASGIYTLNASGQHRADFKYTIGGTQYTQSQYINVYTHILTQMTFLHSTQNLKLPMEPHLTEMRKGQDILLILIADSLLIIIPKRLLILMAIDIIH